MQSACNGSKLSLRHGHTHTHPELEQWPGQCSHMSGLPPARPRQDKWATVAVAALPSPASSKASAAFANARSRGCRLSSGKSETRIS